MEHIILVAVLAVGLAFSPFLSSLTRLPITVVEIGMGVALTAAGLIHENELFTLMAEVGFLYLMFLAGLEINIHQLQKIPMPLFNKGLVYIFFLFMFSMLAHLGLGVSPIFAVVFPLISIGVVMTLTKEFPKETPWLKLSLQIGVLGELASIVLLTFTSAFITYGASWEFTRVMFTLGGVLAAIAGLYYFGRVLFWWYPEFKVRLMPHSDSKDQDVRLSISFFFLMVIVMLFLGLELALGAFLAGMFISTFFEHKRELPEKLSSFGFGFLVPLFFLYIGSTLELEALATDGLFQKALLVVAVMILIRLAASLIFWKEYGPRDTLLFALSQSMPLTLVVAVATIAVHQNSIDRFHYNAFILAAVAEVLISLVLIKLVTGFSRARAKEKASPESA